jgi:hypothetical protein
MRRFPITIAAALLAAAATATAGLATSGHGFHGQQRSSSYAIGLWGDLPYSNGNGDTAYVQKTTGVPNLIADMNGQKLAFTAHDGDLKDGSSTCSDDTS